MRRNATIIRGFGRKWLDSRGLGGFGVAVNGVRRLFSGRGWRPATFAAMSWTATACCALAWAGMAHARTGPEGAESTETDSTLLEPLPAIETMGPVEGGDPALMMPLPPLATFDMAPREDFAFTADTDAQIPYRMVAEGLGGTGIEGTFRSMSALRGDKSATRAQILSRANSDEALLQRLLFSEGWYGALVESAIDDDPESGATVRFNVTPGERFRWREITLDLYPDAPLSLTEGFALKVGEPIRAIEVDLAEGELLIKMRREGYPFAAIGARDVVLDEETPTGTYLLTADVGPRGRFGQVRMSGYQPFSEEHAQRIARFKPGDLYDVDMVDDLRQALIQTQLFGGVTAMTVDTGERLPDGTAITDVRVQGNRGPLRQMGGQVGYATGEGFRAEALWRHRQLIKPEGAFTARAVAGTREQRLAAELAMNNFGQRDRTLAGMFDIANVNRPAFQARTATIAASLARLSTPIWQKRWVWSAGVELVASDERDRSVRLDPPRETYLIAALPLMIGYDASDDLLDPTTGFRLSLRASPEFSRQGGVSHTYVKLLADTSAYQSVSDSLVLAGRARVGSILGAQRINIAPTRRLYAGGGGSVRGFDYQDIGPLGADDRPLGGRGLAEASFEARYRFGDFGVVGFVDAGTLTESSTPTLKDVHVGAGVGVRYYTSFGPIRVDVARAINNRQRAPVIGLYISIGQAF